jgi:hypothetical protein
MYGARCAIRQYVITRVALRETFYINMCPALNHYIATSICNVLYSVGCYDPSASSTHPTIMFPHICYTLFLLYFLPSAFFQIRFFFFNMFNLLKPSGNFTYHQV